MAIQSYAKGARKEREIKKQLESEGWLVIRSAGSKIIDLVAMKKGRCRLIEVKSYTPFPKKIKEIMQELLRLESISGFNAELILPISKEVGD